MLLKSIKKIFHKITNTKKSEIFNYKRLNQYEKSYEFIELDYAKVAYLERGNGKNIVLFLHGMTEDALNWFYTMEYLYIKNSGFTLVAIDLPGFGQTEVNNDFKINIDNFIQLIRDFIEKKGYEKVTLVGHSLGGQTAALFAHGQPEYVEKLILVDTAGFKRFSTVTSEFFRAMKVPGNLLKKITLFDLLKLLLNNPIFQNKEYYQKIMYEIVMSRKNSLTDYFIERNYKKLSAEGLDRLHAMKQSMDTMLDSQIYIDDKLPELKIPVCFIWGEEDHLVPIRYGYKGYDLISHENKNFYVFRKTGHYPLLERPRDFSEAVFKFVLNID